MSLDQYTRFKNRFDNTKPIRGRSVECRPIANRARDWEEVIKKDIDGQEAYGAKLYNTDCVMYLPNGDMQLTIDAWATPTTADFIERYISREMRCYKKYNKIWVDYKDKSYVLNHDKPTIFKYLKHIDTYSVENPAPLVQKVVDRTKAKDARKPVDTFRNYAKIMLKLADGWLSNDLVEKHCKPKSADYWGRVNYDINGEEFSSYHLQGQITKQTAEKLYDYFSTNDETQFPKMLCVICAGSNYKESRVIRTEQYETTDYKGNKNMETRSIREHQYDWKTIDNRINHIVKQACDVYTTKEVEVGKVVTNLL